MTVSTISTELLILLPPNLVVWYIMISWNVLCKIKLLFLRSRSKTQERFKISVNVHLDDTSSSVEPSVTKLGMVMRHQGPECHARRLVCCLQVHGQSGGSFN